MQQISSISGRHGSSSQDSLSGSRIKEAEIQLKKSSYVCLILLLLVAALMQLAISEYLLTQFISNHRLIDKSRGGTLTNRRDDQFLNNLVRFKTNKGPPHPIGTMTSSATRNRTIAYMLEHVGLEATPPDFLGRFPPLEEISALYGDEVIIPGLVETCEAYRKAVPLQNRHTGPAGMFNSGTNLLYSLLVENCQLPNHRFGIVWQVPWGKHTPLSWKRRNFPKHWLSVEHDDTLAIVVIKDPFTWLRSMCRESYNAKWPRSPNHCPNLIKTELDRYVRELKALDMGQPVPVFIKYNASHITNHTNLIALWNDWYGAYWNDPEPRLFIRYEDMLFRPYETINQLCTCIGGNFTYQGTFKYVKRSAKGERGSHLGSSNLMSALLRYSNSTERIHGFSQEDLKVAASDLNKVLLDTFHYPIPTIHSYV